MFRKIFLYIYQIYIFLGNTHNYEYELKIKPPFFGVEHGPTTRIFFIGPNGTYIYIHTHNEQNMDNCLKFRGTSSRSWWFIYVYICLHHVQRWKIHMFVSEILAFAVKIYRFKTSVSIMSYLLQDHDPNVQNTQFPSLLWLNVSFLLFESHILLVVPSSWVSPSLLVESQRRGFNPMFCENQGVILCFLEVFMF